jgi:DedD protein
LKQIESSALQDWRYRGFLLEQAVKQRLVGAAVLTALAAITLPLIFDTSRPPAVQVPEAIPMAPPQNEIAMPEPQTVPLPPDRPAGEPQSVDEMYKMEGDGAVDTSGAAQSPPVGASGNAVVDGAVVDQAAPDNAADVNDVAVDADQSAPAPVPVVAPAAPAKPVPVPPKAPVKTASAPPAPATKLDSHGVPESWVVQVAAMSDRKAADSLVAKLTLNGYSPFTRISRDSKGETIRVFVGPKLDKSQAQRLKQKLDREQGLQTMVKPFSPK